MGNHMDFLHLLSWKSQSDNLHSAGVTYNAFKKKYMYIPFNFQFVLERLMFQKSQLYETQTHNS
jgi:hypothetical protein